MLFDFHPLQVVQHFLAGQKVRPCRRGSPTGPGAVLGYSGDSRFIVLDILRVHVYLTDRTNDLYREFSTCRLLTGRYSSTLFSGHPLSFAQKLKSRASQQLR